LRASLISTNLESVINRVNVNHQRIPCERHCRVKSAYRFTKTIGGQFVYSASISL